jgi:RTX calcium-binding nonapeptide repeat (4 copies)
MNFKFIQTQQLGGFARLLVCLFGLVFLTACKSEDQERQEQYQATVNHENGRLVTVNGEKLRIVYIGGVRFRFPDTRQFRVVGGRHANRPEHDGIDMELYRLDIQKDKLTGKEIFRWLDGEIEKPSLFIAQVRGTTKPVDTNPTKEPPVPSQYQLSQEFCHDDLSSGLRLCGSKDFPKHPIIGYSLKPLKYKMYIYSNFMYINFRANVKVRISMNDMQRNINPNPDWKRIYTITITLKGGSGIDTLIGGKGNDFYYVDLANDLVVETVNEGVDTVISTSDYTLSANTENLILEESGGYIDGIGNTSMNHITGNSYDNRLDGGDGDDTPKNGVRSIRHLLYLNRSPNLM